MRRARASQQAQVSPYTMLACGASGRTKGTDGGEGLAGATPRSAAQRPREVGGVRAVLLAAGRDVPRGHGTGRSAFFAREERAGDGGAPALVANNSCMNILAAPGRSLCCGCGCGCRRLLLVVEGGSNHSQTTYHAREFCSC